MKTNYDYLLNSTGILDGIMYWLGYVPKHEYNKTYGDYLSMAKECQELEKKIEAKEKKVEYGQYTDAVKYRKSK